MDAMRDFFTAYPAVFWMSLGLLYVGMGTLVQRWTRDQRGWLILGATFLGLVFMLPIRDKLKLGIDLKGGTILVYQVDTAKVVGGWGSDQMDRWVAALSKRTNPAGTYDMTIRAMGGDRIEIVLPAASPQEVESIQKRITQLGRLEFRILANDKHDGDG